MRSNYWVLILCVSCASPKTVEPEPVWLTMRR